MKQTQLDKHTIAWFKIAECVSRGEKERALGVYRLLSHSFNDTAVARQLEADIYFSFGEQEHAIALYRQAMELYQKSERFLEAVAVCEHVLVMRPHDLLLRREAIKLYRALGIVSKIQMHIRTVLDDIFVTNNEQQVQELLSSLRAESDELYEYALAHLKKV
jgi:tetratricopeptide (TPR) repeat protein